MGNSSLRQIFTDIAYAIRAISGSNETMTPMQMPQKILDACEVSGTATTPSATLPSVFQAIADSIRAVGGTGTFSPLEMPSVINYISLGKTRVEYIDGTVQEFKLSGTITAGTTSSPTTDITNCVNARKIWLGKDVTGLGNYSFCNCINLEYLYIPSTVTSIGNYVFRNTTSLSSIDVSGNNQSWCFSNQMLLSKDGTTLKWHCGSGDLILPSTISSLANYSFNSKTDITSVDMSNTTIQSTGTGTFRYCSNLTTVVFPGTITTVSTYALNSCTSLEVADFRLAQQIPTTTTNAWASTNRTYKIVVPDSLFSTWIASGNWKNSSIIDHIIRASNYANL